MIKVHLIFNAHLDPVWLWSWRDGLDEVLNTGYYMCDLLDRHPDLIYTRGEAWVYEQIARIDPALFERISAHIRAGRWTTVGGWYIQPDCNQPSGFAMERQISLGQKFFRDAFGHAPVTGYNVDSFGHAATLPGYLHRAGQSNYVMMRPQEHEMKLPARIFRWRGYAEGPEVTTFRIARGYTTSGGLNDDHLLASVTELPEGVSDTMCFIGIGDHGGGPSEEMIAWCRENRTRFPGLELVISSPDKFFSALQPQLEKLPLVIGELQMHAVGCYTVHRPVKVALRQAEHRLMQAEIVLQKFPAAAAEFAPDLLVGWKQVCFHHFHDTLGGTCLPSAYEDVQAQLGRALAIADEITACTLRRQLVLLEPNSAQRSILMNASELPFEDFVEIEPWLEWTVWQSNWQLRNEQDQSVPFQLMDQEAQAGHQNRLLIPISLAPGEIKILRIVDGQSEGKPSSTGGTDITADTSSLSVANGPSFRLEGAGVMEWSNLALPLPQLALYDDPTDTWSHGIDRYARTNGQVPEWKAAQVVDKGPLMASLVRVGRIASSRVQAEWRVYGGRPWIDCFLRVIWAEERRVLKLELELPSDIAEREDGILGGSLPRPNDGRELPLRDWTRVQMKNKSGEPVHFAVISPDVYALDGEASRIGLTLLRGPLMAWHDPHPGIHPRGVFSDRGEHFFHFRFLAVETISVADLDQIAFGWQRPPLRADLTRGMKNRAGGGKYMPPAFP